MGGKSQFSKGMEVEVCSDDQGLRGAWFVAKILQSIPRKKKALIQYQTLISETSKPLKEFVDLINLRPIAPRETNFNFDFSDEVDAYHNDGWWEGIVTRVLVKENSSSRYLVYFRNGKEEIEFGEDELRVHREWVHGNWIPPMETASVEEEKARGNEEGESGVVVIEDVDDLQPQEKLRMDGDHTQIGIRSDKTQLPLVSNINDLVRTIPVHEATITEGSGSCGNFVASRCESSNLDHFSCSNLTADIAHEFDTLEEATKQPTTEISSPCEKLNEVEMTEGSPVIIAEAEHVIPSTPTPEGEETSLQNKKEATQNMSDIISSPGEKLNEVEMMLGSPVLISQVEQAMSFTPTPGGEETSLQNKKEITQNMSDIISGPSEQLNDHLAPSSSQENTGTVTDCDISGCRSRIVTTPPINNERLCNSSETQLQCLEQNHNVHLPADEQQCLDAGWLCLEASVDSKEHPENLSLPEPKVDKEKKKRRPSQQCSNNLLEERKKRPSQQCPKLPEPFIPSDEQQRCRRTGKGWRCSTMAFPRKRYCEKHEIEQNVRNQKRRKRPIEETHVMMEPFQPTDPPQQCRRSGKGWRCRAMASSGKRYCDKHQLEQNVHNEKKRQKRKLREEPCLAVEMDIDGRPNQGDTENIGPENVSQIGNTVDCIVNMQCEVERSALSDVAVSSENNEVDAARDDQSDASELIQWKAGGSDEVHALQVGHNTSVGFSNETETKKRMTGAFSDEFWPVFIT